MKPYIGWKETQLVEWEEGKKSKVFKNTSSFNGALNLGLFQVNSKAQLTQLRGPKLQEVALEKPCCTVPFYSLRCYISVALKEAEWRGSSLPNNTY